MVLNWFIIFYLDNRTIKQFVHTWHRKGVWLDGSRRLRLRYRQRQHPDFGRRNWWGVWGREAHGRRSWIRKWLVEAIHETVDLVISFSLFPHFFNFNGLFLKSSVPLLLSCRVCFIGQKNVRVKFFDGDNYVRRKKK